MNYRNVIDLLKDAFRWEYTEINDTKDTQTFKKPWCFFTRIQWIFILIAIMCTMLCPKGINSAFAGYIISGLSLFVGILFTVVVALFDRVSKTDFEPYKLEVSEAMYKRGVRLKNFYKKTITLILYSSILAIVCILMLALILIWDKMGKEINIETIVDNIHIYSNIFLIKVLGLLVYRTVLFYILFNFLYITIDMIASFYDLMISEIDKIHLK